MLTAWYINEKVIKSLNMNRYLVTVGILAFCVCSLASIANYTKSAKESGTYQAKENIISVLETNGLSYGYASYWNAQILNSMSDYEVIVRPVVVSSTLTPFVDINYIDSFSPSRFRGKTFLLLTAQEYESLTHGEVGPIVQELGAPKETLAVEDYYICVYDHNISEDLYYFPYNEGYVPIQGSYREAENVLAGESCDLAAAEELQIKTFPVEILPNSYYKVTFTVETECIPELFYLDLWGENYDFAAQDKTVSLEPGTQSYEAIIPSGDMVGMNSVLLRFICETSSPLKLSDINVTLLELI